MSLALRASERGVGGCSGDASSPANTKWRLMVIASYGTLYQAGGCVLVRGASGCDLAHFLSGAFQNSIALLVGGRVEGFPSASLAFFRPMETFATATPGRQRLLGQRNATPHQHLKAHACGLGTNPTL